MKRMVGMKCLVAKRISSKKLHKIRKNKSNKGMTLVEMIVSFMLLSIFVVAATVVIANVVSLYYRIRGESYSRQVGDILMTKISSELTGAVYDSGNELINPYLTAKDNNGNRVDGSAADLYDKTETHIRIFAEDGMLKIYYYPIEDGTDPDNDRTNVFWTFDKKVYNGYSLEKLDFAQACTERNETLAEEYGISDVNKDDYPCDIMAVYMKLKSGKYGEFTICRYIRMYNLPEKDYNMEYESGE